MMDERITHASRIWRWTAKDRGGWLFLTIEGAAAQALADTALMRRLEIGRARGFGSLRVCATIGETSWQTSVFPVRGGEAWHLPLKAAVCKAEGLEEDDEARVTLEVL